MHQSAKAWFYRSLREILWSTLYWKKYARVLGNEWQLRRIWTFLTVCIDLKLSNKPLKHSTFQTIQLSPHGWQRNKSAQAWRRIRTNQTSRFGGRNRCRNWGYRRLWRGTFLRRINNTDWTKDINLNTWTWGCKLILTWWKRMVFGLIDAFLKINTSTTNFWKHWKPQKTFF